MSLTSNIYQNKWVTDLLAYVQSALQVLLFMLILLCLGVAWWRYQSTVFVISEVKLDANRPMESTGDGLTSNPNSVGFYTDLVERRDIFRFAADPSASVVTQFAVAPANQDLMTRFIVQGVVYDLNPMAIIKDIQSNKIYFLHRSEMLEDAKLVDIKDNRVIFDRNGETLELIKK